MTKRGRMLPARPVLNTGHPLSRGLHCAYPAQAQDVTDSGTSRTWTEWRDVGPKRIHLPLWWKTSAGATAVGYGELGRCVELVGQDAFGWEHEASLNLPNATMENLACSFHLKPTGAGSTYGIVWGRYTEFAVYVSWNSGSPFVWFTSGGTEYVSGGGSPLPTDRVSHVVLTFKDNGTNADYEIWINGELTRSATCNYPTRPAVWNIGIDTRFDSEHFVGELYDTRMWLRSLSPREVQDLYTDPWGHYRRPSLPVGLVPAAGGADYVAVINEAIGVTEATSRILGMVRVLSEPIDVGETLIRSVGMVRVVSEAVSIGETTPRSLGMIRVVVEAVDIGETTPRVVGMVRVIDEAIGISESVIAQLGIVRVIVEPIGIGESIVSRKGIVRVITELIDIGETTVDLAGIIRVVNESIGITEDVVDVAGLVRTINEAIGVGETVAKTAILVRVVSETIDIGETALRVLGLVRVVDETIDIGETIFDVTGFIRVINELIDIGETTVDLTGLVRVINESIGLSESVVNLAGLVRIINESIDVGETTLRTMQIVRVVDELIDIGEESNRVLGLIRVVDESIDIGETTFNTRGLVRVINEPIDIGETEFHYPGRVVVISETIDVGESVIDLKILATGLHETASNKVRRAFGSNITNALPVPTMFDNAPFGQPDVGVWTQLNVEHGGTVKLSTGGSQRYQMHGVMTATVQQSLSEGDFNGREVAEAVVNVFEGRVLELVNYGTAIVSPLGRVDGRHQISVAIPFTLDFEERVTARQSTGAVLDATQVGDLVRTWFAAKVATPETLPTLYDNAPFNGPDDALWARLSVLEGAGGRVATRGTQQVHRHFGEATVQIFVPLSTGDGVALQTADTIADAFRAVTVDGLRFRVPQVRTVGEGREGKWWQINVSCPFTYETVSPL